MRDRPTALELLDAVEGHLREELLPELEGSMGFQVRVAANVVGIVRRELELGRAFDDEEHARLMSLLERDGELEELERELCRRIRAGEIALDDPRLQAHLVRAALTKLAIDNPRYAGYRLGCATWPDLAP